MIRLNNYNDSPIHTPEDDKYGIDGFAQALARCVIKIESPVGVTIALNGKWGSGKSSAVNLIRYHLKRDLEEDRLEIIDFKCWWFRGEEALTLAFLQELNTSLQKSIGDKVKNLIPQLGKKLLQAGPVIGPAVNIATGGLFGVLTSGSMDFAKRFFPEGENIEKLFQEISEALVNQNKRFLVLIDDIDRLTPDEALLIFRLVKSVGRLPNIIYLLIFDRKLAEKNVKKKYPSEGPHFLEKIIQASFELPLPSHDDLQNEALFQIQKICGLQEETKQQVRFMNIFYDAVSPYLKIPRDLIRLLNSMTVSWPAVAGEVDIADYLALEVMRLFEPSLYNEIRMNKNLVCDVRPNYHNREDPENEINRFLKIVKGERKRKQVEVVLKRLFPCFENKEYPLSFLNQWKARRLVCSYEHFDTYFRMAIGDETLSMHDINEFIKNCHDQDFIKKAFYKARVSIRKKGRSKVPLLFNELNVYASRIDMKNYQTLISTIFQIADDIYREEDQPIHKFYPQIHNLIYRLTFERCNLFMRNDILSIACKGAQVGWLVNFTRSAIIDYEGGEPKPPEEYLVEKEYLTKLKSHTLDVIESTADSGKLITHPYLLEILKMWRRLAEDDISKIKNWIKEQLKDDVALSMLARAFTGESYSQEIGLFGLGDRVSTIEPFPFTKELSYYINVDEFRRCLEEVEKSNSLDGEQKKNIQVFLEALRKHEKGNNYKDRL